MAVEPLPQLRLVEEKSSRVLLKEVLGGVPNVVAARLEAVLRDEETGSARRHDLSVFDELLNPYDDIKLDVKSISIMGKAGILDGNIGDIILPTAHIFEGTVDNYPLENSLKVEDFKDSQINVVEGPMITVLGTSLQNKNIL